MMVLLVIQDLLLSSITPRICIVQSFTKMICLSVTLKDTLMLIVTSVLESSGKHSMVTFTIMTWYVNEYVMSKM